MSTNERRMAVPFEIKAVDDSGSFSGRGSVFNKLDSYRDIVLPGAFKKSLDAKGARGIKMLSQHNPFANPIGIWTDIRESKEALEVEGQLALRTSLGQETHELLKLGAPDGLSIGFRTIESETDPKTDIRQVSEIDLWEISVVTFPAQAAALVSDVRNFHQLPKDERLQFQDALRRVADLCETERDFEAFLRDAGWSRREAEILVSKGFKGLELQGDPDDELSTLVKDLRSLAKSINK